MTDCLQPLLELDLDSGRQAAVPIDPQTGRMFLGGSALAARLAFDACPPDCAPLAPESPLYIMAGPLTGTTFPGSSRFVICARSPLTGRWGESASGGTFGADLRKAGYDGVVIRGRAAAPVYLLIDDGQAMLVDAADLWGRDTYDTIDLLWERHGGPRKARVLAIGPAGEKRVRFASVANDKAHHCGRTGMGAVFGSKHLKAVVVRGSGRVPVADPEAFARARADALAAVKASMVAESMHALGTNAAMDMGMMTGDVPIKNWSVGVDYDLADALGGPALETQLLKKRGFCYACPIGCKPVVAIEAGPYRLPLGPGPEYEACAGFGTLILNADLAAVAYANERCNRLGLDTISTSGTIAFVMEAFERGLLTAEQADGLKVGWGDMTAVLALIEKIAARDGFGNRAAEGSDALARALGPPADNFCITVNGLELPMHDPRAYHGQGLAYLMSTRGACHLQHTVQAVEQGMVDWSAAGLQADYEATASDGKAHMVYLSENIGQVSNAACVCQFVLWAMGIDPLRAGLAAVTGREWGLERFLRLGARAWTVKRLLNLRFGLTPADERLPARIRTPLADGGAAGSVPDEALMKTEYYRIRGLDANGAPGDAQLTALGLAFAHPGAGA